MGVNKKRKDEGKPIVYQRCLCGLVIDKVEYMQTQQIDINDRSQFLNFLSFYKSGQTLGFTIFRLKTIRLSVNSLKLTVKDLGESWPTTQCPKHEEIDLDGDSKTIGARYSKRADPL